MASLQLPSQHLVTHGVVLGMTGSGKTGLLMVMVEEALRSQVPVLMIDVKGDLPNLLLAFPSFDAEPFVPWVDGHDRASEGEVRERAAALAAEREKQLAGWSISDGDVAAFGAGIHARVLTPGSSAGEPVHILSALERRPQSWNADPEGARAALSAAISLVLRLLGRDSDPAKSREHVLLSVLAERRLMLGQTAELGSLLEEVLQPPLERIGALRVNDFLSVKERRTGRGAQHAAGLTHVRQLAAGRFARYRRVAHAARRAHPGGDRERGAPG